MAEWKKLSSDIVFSHPRMILAEEKVQIPSGETIDYLVITNQKSYPTVIARNDEGKILMIREHAYPVNQALLQFPEGEMGDGETVEQAAKREMGEETGLMPGEVHEIGTNLHHHRRSQAVNHIILATHLAPIPEGSQLVPELEEGDIELVWLTENEIWDAIKNGDIIQKNALAAWATYSASVR